MFNLYSIERGDLMEFLLSSRSRVVVQLNREAERSFGVNDFVFGKPQLLDDDGKTSLLITPVSDTVNRGNSITLTYSRRVINSAVNIGLYADADVVSLIRDLEIASRVEFEPGCWEVVTRPDGEWLIIDDYVVYAKLKLEHTTNETL